MNIVEFDKELSLFQLTREGITTPYNYIPNSKNLWKNLNKDDFTVVVLNNPFLHSEESIFEIKFDGSDERGGYLFPIELLESEEGEGKQLLSYMFVAYNKLLVSFPDNCEATGLLSDCYKDAFILIIHNATKPDFNFQDYILALAKQGFYEYQGEIKGKYPSLDYFKDLPKTLRLDKKEVDNSSCGYVVDLLKNRLCFASDFITRFVLLYQVIEQYISEIHRTKLDEAIEKYKQEELNKNDFSEELKNISRESNQIEVLMKPFSDEAVCNNFRQVAMGLFNDVGYKPKNESLPTLIYALRNQVFHSYEIFSEHEDGLNQVIFSFEEVILMLLSKQTIKTLPANTE